MPKTETPEWLEHTPDQRYILSIVTPEYVDEVHAQEIDLTRDEYIALKQHLAGIRGYQVT